MSTRLEALRPANRRRWVGLAAGCALLLLCVGCGAGLAGWWFLNQRQTVASPPSVEYVLDASARMALPSANGDGTRLAVAQSVLDEVIRPSTPSLTAGLRVFGTGKYSDGCADTDLLVPLAPSSQTKISASLLAVTTGAQADAAMADAVVGALRDLRSTHGAHTLVVVTGGSDSCSEQAGQLILAEAKRDGIDYQLFVIGYQVPVDQGTAVSSQVDQGPSGHYISVNSRDQLLAVLQAVQQYAENPPANTVAAVMATAAAVAPTAASSASALPASGTPAATQTQTATTSVTPTLTPTSTPSQTSTSTSTATSTDTASPAPTLAPSGTASQVPTVALTNTPSPTPDLFPKVTSFLARFDPQQASTFYSVTVSSPVAALASPAVAAAGPALSYHWSNTNKCGQFSGTDTPVAQWFHPDVPGGCPVEPVHPGTITVIVTNAYGATRCDYAGGSAPGNIVRCQEVKQ